MVSVESSFGFAHADKYETVFLPGIAFDPSIVSSIDTYIRPQDQVVLKIQAQNEYKGCKWKAVEVVKQFKVNKEEEDIVYTSCGIVSAVTDDHVLLYDETHGVDVTLVNWIAFFRMKISIQMLYSYIRRRSPRKQDCQSFVRSDTRSGRNHVQSGTDLGAYPPGARMEASKGIR